MTEHLVGMGVMGLVVSLGAPGVLLVLLRLCPQAERCAVRPVFAFPGFVVLHAAVTVLGHMRGQAFHAPMFVLLLLGAVLFWAPVLGQRYRLPDAVRMLYLYTAMPLLDMAGVWLVAAGDATGGLSMIVGMLPMGVVAVVVTWRWIVREERATAAGEAAELRKDPRFARERRSHDIP